MKRQIALVLGFGLVLLTASKGAPAADVLVANRHFDFSRYCSPAEMKDALRELFPRGTPKSVVEEKLVKEGGATIQLDDRPRSNPHILHYHKDVYCNPEDSRWGVNVHYDKRDQVRQISFTGGSNIFPETPPEDRTDAGIFRFEDYNDADDLMLTLRTLFPKGTPRAQVERVLVNWALSTVLNDPNESQIITYRHSYRTPVVNGGKRVSEERVWNVRVDYFKDDNTLSQITLDGSKVRTAFSLDEGREYFVNHKKKRK